MVPPPVQQMVARNGKYAETFTPSPTLPQLKAFAETSGQAVIVITCSDPRLNGYQIFGVEDPLGTIMIRNAGGRVFDLLRSIAVLQTIANPCAIIVMHHSDCGMTHFHDEDIRKILLEMAPEDKEAIEAQKFGEMLDGVESSIREDLALLKASPWVKKGIELIGLKYDTRTGLVSYIE